ncbi:MAG TPA: AI-2E family transporter, partial [Gemmatimonadaceae bacterium]
TVMMPATPALPDTKPGARILVLSVALLVAIALAPLAVGLASALVLYELFSQPYTRLTRRVRPGLAATLIVLLAVGLVVVPLVWLGVHVGQRLPNVLAKLTAFRASYPDASATGLIAKFQTQIASVASSVGDSLPGAVLSLAHSSVWAIVNWSIAVLGLFYLLGSAPKLWPRFARLLPFSSAGAETLRIRFRDITQGMVAGTMLSSAVQGVAIGTGFWFAGLPDPVFWGACAAITTLVPVVGNALVSGPALLLLLVRQNYTGVIAILVFAGLLPPIIDRVVRATVSRRMGRVHPMITVVGAFIGALIAGVPGLILGPVALAMFFVLLEVYERESVGVQQSQEAMP